MSESEDTYAGIPIDPRVKWAMQIMDHEGHEFESEFDHLLVPGGTGIMPLIGTAFYNFANRYPIKRNILGALAFVPVFFYAGMTTKRWREGIQAENNAMIKHYILTHPERFPEPKRIKYAESIQPWRRERY